MASSSSSVASRILPTLPRLAVPIGHKKQKIKTAHFPNPKGRLEVLRRLVTRLVREERCEFKYNRAEELRPYIERVSRTQQFTFLF